MARGMAHRAPSSIKPAETSTNLNPEKHFVGWSAWRDETQAGNNISQELSRGQWIRSRQSSQPCTHRELLSHPEKPRLGVREQQSENTVPQSTSREEQFNPLFPFILKLRACRVSQELWIQPSPPLLEITLAHIITIPTNPEFPFANGAQQAPGLPLVKRSCLTAGAAWAALPSSPHLRKAPQHIALPSLHTHPLRSGILLCNPILERGHCVHRVF